MPKQDVGVQIFYDGTWHEIVSDDDVFADDPITITRGQGDASPGLRPTSVTMRLANDDDRYRTSNPESPLYGRAGLNTPVRVTVGSGIRAVAQASSWRAGQSRDFRRSPRRGRAWVDLQCGGLAQQINQWTQRLRSALRREVDFCGTTPAEFWPMEDVAGSTSAVSAVGGTPMTPVDTVRYTLPDGSPLAPGGAPDFERGPGVPGSEPLVSFQAGGTLRAPVRTATYNGYAIDWVMQFRSTADPLANADVLAWRESGTYRQFTVNVTKGNVTVFHANAAAVTAGTSSGSANLPADPFDGIAHHYRYQVRQNGGDYSATLYMDGGATGVAVADNFVPGMAGTVGVPQQVEWNPGEDSGDFMPAAAGHLLIWPSGQPGDQPAIFRALNGRIGERAAYRYFRIMSEQGLTSFVSPSFNLSTPMGPQKADTLAGLLREIATTDDALLFDVINQSALFLMSRADRYNRTSRLDLYPEDLPFLPEEVTDDLEPGNVVTAVQRAGGDFTARDDTGPLGTQDPPNGVGEYQKRVDVNVADPTDDLPQHANYWLRRSTVNLPRYPRLMINLGAMPRDRAARVEAVDIGDVITINAYRENVIRLHVLGIVEVIGNNARTITFNCASDLQFRIRTYDAARYDLRTCTLSAAAGPTVTSLALATTADEAWSSTSAYDVMIAGELVGVPAGGMGARTGTGPYAQTITGAVRSKNGIRKTLPAGSSVRVATPGRYGL